MSKMNWDRAKPRYALHTSKATAAKKYEKLERQKATYKQIKYMELLKIQFPEKVTKLQAMELITKKLAERSKYKTSS